jgi:hypothetical protein
LIHLPTKSTGRSKASLALAIVLALIAAMFAMASPARALDVPDKVTICHRTAAESNPYRKITVNVDGSNGSLRGDHLSHTGPVFPATAGDPPKWGDIIPPYGDFSGQNWTEGGQAIFRNGCPAAVPVTPLPPTVTQPTCSLDGALVLPPAQEGVTYTVDPAYNGQPGTYVVTATAGEAFVFPEGELTQTWTLEVLPKLSRNDPACITSVTPATPQDPIPPTCEANGVLVPPGPQTGVIWKVTPDGTGPATYIITATPAEGYTFGGATTSWERVVLPKLTQGCSISPPAAAIPAPVSAPTFIDASCAAPNATAMTIPANTGQIAYTATPSTATPGGTVRVTAAPIGNVALTGYPAGGWSHKFAAIPTNCDAAVGGIEDEEDPTEADTPDEAVAGSEDELAATGGSAGPAGLGFLLILSGAAFVTARRLALR